MESLKLKQPERFSPLGLVWFGFPVGFFLFVYFSTVVRQMMEFEIG